MCKLAAQFRAYYVMGAHTDLCPGHLLVAIKESNTNLSIGNIYNGENCQYKSDSSRPAPARPANVTTETAKDQPGGFAALRRAMARGETPKDTLAGRSGIDTP